MTSVHLVDALRWIEQNYANQNMAHVDYRVEACSRAQAALAAFDALPAQDEVDARIEALEAETARLKEALEDLTGAPPSGKKFYCEMLKDGAEFWQIWPPMPSAMDDIWSVDRMFVKQHTERGAIIEPVPDMERFRFKSDYRALRGLLIRLPPRALERFDAENAALLGDPANLFQRAALTEDQQ